MNVAFQKEHKNYKNELEYSFKWVVIPVNMSQSIKIYFHTE